MTSADVKTTVEIKVTPTYPVLSGDCPGCGGRSISWLVEGISNGYVDACVECVQDVARDALEFRRSVES